MVEITMKQCFLCGEWHAAIDTYEEPLAGNEDICKECGPEGYAKSWGEEEAA